MRVRPGEKCGLGKIMYEEIDRREFLLKEVKHFVENTSMLDGVKRIALVGSLTTNKPKPKDADVLVTIGDSVEMDRLAAYGRRLMGKGQSQSSGADIFLCNEVGDYLGRTCGYRECHPRVLCEGSLCRPGNRINNDFHQVKLDSELINKPPIVLWPDIEARVPVPKDVEEIFFNES
jgi:hypothetical protein